MSAPAVQGGLVIARAPRSAQSVTLNGVALPLTADGFFLMGFDRDAESSAILTATFADGRTLDRTLAITPGNWRIEMFLRTRRAAQKQPQSLRQDAARSSTA